MLVVHEDVKTLGLGAELSAVIMEEQFDALDAPVLRVTYPDTHAPFSHVLEAANLPNTDKIADALRKLVALTDTTDHASTKPDYSSPVYRGARLQTVISSRPEQRAERLIDVG